MQQQKLNFLHYFQYLISRIYKKFVKADGCMPNVLKNIQSQHIKMQNKKLHMKMYTFNI